MLSQRLSRAFFASPCLSVVKIPAYPCQWSGYLQGTCIPLTLVRYLQGTCIPLTLVRIPAGYLHTPDTGQDTREERKISYRV